ncbi:MAG TPA: alkaline phosphatase family protein, partial [Nitrososphaera sp.]
IVSEYGFNDVKGAIPLNLILREAGLVSVLSIEGKEYLDFEHSKAFAMVDHQVAHIYIKPGFEGVVRKLLGDTPRIDRVLDSKDKKGLAIDHERSGELIAISAKDMWFSYYWWQDENKAPEFAHKVDIHRKPGYDPVELFFNQKTRSIPFDVNLVKGSHGRPPDLETGEGLAFYASSKKHELATKSTPAKCVDIMKCLFDSK